MGAPSEMYSRTRCRVQVAGSGLDFLQKFPQVHFRHPLWPSRRELCSTLLTVVLITARWRSKYRVEAEGLDVPLRPLARLVQDEESGLAAVMREAEEDWAR